MNLKIHELILSTIQGEGHQTGEPIDLIRLYGCPVGCSFCDTGYSSEDDYGKNIKYEIISQNKLFSQIKSNSILITGGEPFINKKLGNLCENLIKLGHKVSVETSGSFLQIIPENVWITLSPKEHLKNRYRVKDYFWNRANEIKLIVAKPEDYFYYEKIIGQYFDGRESKLIFLQPEWSNKEKILPFILKKVHQNQNLKISAQLHKFLNIK